MAHINKGLHGLNTRKMILADLKIDERLFQPRQRGIEPDHVQALVRVLRRGTKLEPLDVWRNPAGNLWLINGHHRRAALMKIGRKRHNARIYSGSLAQARLVSIASNSQDRLVLCTADRTQFAWQLHRDHRDAFSIAELARAAGISPKTVSNMRAAYTKLADNGFEVPERWITARKEASDHAREFPCADREAIFHEKRTRLTDKIRGPIVYEARQDPGMVFDVVADAMGRCVFARIAAERGFHRGDVNEYTGEFTLHEPQRDTGTTPF